MYAWWPKSIPAALIPVFRSLGRKASYGRPTSRDDLPVGVSNVTRPLTFGHDLSLREQDLMQRLPTEVIYFLGKVLADGVKLFDIPAGFNALDEIEIPLSVKDYVQPFPAVVVRAGDKYHFVVHDNASLCIGSFDHTKHAGGFEWSNMLASERSIESYLTNQFIVTGLPGTGYSAIVHEPDAFSHHRFRATLNFLLICTMEGVVASKVKVPQRLKRHPLARLAKPTAYRPQNIELLKRRYSEATKGGDHDRLGIVGSMKRPHWRRAHWRRVAVGVGRCERQLRFIRASFIHKELIGSLSATASTYKVGSEVVHV